MLTLSPNQIDIWLTCPNEIRDHILLQQYRQLLTADERDKEQRFHFDHDKHQYLITRALVRTVLSKYTHVLPEQWIFSTNAYGKPEIVNVDDLGQKIAFNISHTDGLIALGVTGETALGVDVENIAGRQAPIDSAEQFFSPDEVMALQALPLKAQQNRFFQYWTLKESYMKARGMGLSIPLEHSHFYLEDETHIQVSFHPLLNDHASRWHFWQFAVFSDYLLSICVARREKVKPQITLQKIVPLKAEDSVVCQLLRQS